jgi:serine/threonine-protein kinase RsbW
MQPTPEANDQAEQLHLAFLASAASVRENLRRLMSQPLLSNMPDDVRGTAELVLAEVLNNVAEHAYADRPGPVSVTLHRDLQGIDCLIVDQGAAMPGGSLPEGRSPGAELGLDDLPEGGFGWHLIRTLTLDIGYARIDGCNRLSFRLPLSV